MKKIITASILATALFSLTSVLCGAATNLGMLIVFRALQGFVAGPILTALVDGVGLMPPG